MRWQERERISGIRPSPADRPAGRPRPEHTQRATAPARGTGKRGNRSSPVRVLARIAVLTITGGLSCNRVVPPARAHGGRGAERDRRVKDDQQGKGWLAEGSRHQAHKVTRSSSRAVGAARGPPSRRVPSVGPQFLWAQFHDPCSTTTRPVPRSAQAPRGCHHLIILFMGNHLCNHGTTQRWGFECVSWIKTAPESPCRLARD